VFDCRPRMDPTSSPDAPLFTEPDSGARCRECWEATRTLRAARPGDFAAARAQLHLAGLLAGLRALAPEAREAPLDGLGAAVTARLREALATGRVGADDPEALEALEVAHRRALEAVEQPRRAARARQERRWVLGGFAALAVAAATLGAVQLWGWWRAPPDLAEGRPWSTSSSAAACEPREGRCAGEHTRVLFYTREEPRPWYQVDLGQLRAFTWVTVRNRGDALLERAIPLVLEVSDDGATWREVARRAERFDRWEARFPQVTARYLRARVDRQSVLHLEGVEVHP